MPDVLRDILKYDLAAMDQILGINEQIQTIELQRNIEPEEKMYQWMTDTGNFDTKRNFNDEQLAYANTDKFDEFRDHIFPNQIYNKSTARSHGKSISPFRKLAREIIDPEIARAEKEAQTTPFDQIYHKERKLVQDIIKAEKQLKNMEENLPNPAGHRLFDPTKLEFDEVYGNVFADLEPQHLRDKRAKERIEQRQIQSSIFEESEHLKHKYSQREAKTVEDLIASGQVNKQHYENAKAMNKSNRNINLGYAFITFSNADEA